MKTNCPDCGDSTQMEQIQVVDRSETRWRGFAYVAPGAQDGVFVSAATLGSIQALRCPACDLVRFYAVPGSEPSKLRSS